MKNIHKYLCFHWALLTNISKKKYYHDHFMLVILMVTANGKTVRIQFNSIQTQLRRLHIHIYITLRLYRTFIHNVKTNNRNALHLKICSFMVPYAESALGDYLWMWGLNDTFGKSIVVCSNCFFPS